TQFTVSVQTSTSFAAFASYSAPVMRAVFACAPAACVLSTIVNSTSSPLASGPTVHVTAPVDGVHVTAEEFPTYVRPASGVNVNVAPVDAAGPVLVTR